jgi:hypothetical protein
MPSCHPVAHSHVTTRLVTRMTFRGVRPALSLCESVRTSCLCCESQRSNAAGTLASLPRPADSGACTGKALPPAARMESTAATPPRLALFAASRIARRVGGGSGADVVSRIKAGTVALRRSHSPPPLPGVPNALDSERPPAPASRRSSPATASPARCLAPKGDSAAGRSASKRACGGGGAVA